MKAIRFYRTGGPEVLIEEDVPVPTPGNGEVLIRVDVAGVNYADVVRRNGDPYPLPTPLPFILGADIIGTVEALGEGVSGPPLGTPVMAISGNGGYAQFAVAPSAAVIPLPANLDPVKAAVLPVQGLTAALLVRQAAKVQPGESVLVQAAAGAVGSILTQLLKAIGAGKVIAAASTAQKRQTTLDLGADVAIDYTDPTWPERVRAATDGKGVDVVLEAVGGEITAQSLSCLAQGGRMVMYGVSSKALTSLDNYAVISNNHTISGFNVGAYVDKADIIQAAMGELMGLVLNGRVKLNISESFPLSSVAEVHARVETRKTSGKVVLRPWVTPS